METEKLENTTNSPEDYWTPERVSEYRCAVSKDMEKSKLYVKKYHTLSIALSIACIVTLIITWFSLVGIIFSGICLVGAIISRKFMLKHKTNIIIDMSILVVPPDAY